jgi:hypothetical protein
MKYLLITLLAIFASASCENAWSGNFFNETCTDGKLTQCILSDDNKDVSCTMLDRSTGQYSGCHSYNTFGTNKHRGKTGNCCYDGDDCKINNCVHHICP